MPKHKNVVQFSLNEEQLSILANLANPNESIGLCAKRLLLKVIEQSKPIDTVQSEMLEKRLESLREELQTYIDQKLERLDQLEVSVNELHGYIDSCELPM
ncbi:hypothetical protein [Gloeothece verrucosa]|uniref:Uncharacterized protein n=1 Tax=Gloeothece verrucosa (strain PCC 7822) TaxID=497965 RepID=E0U7V0_GLOV7|nr:hypothetical protein [Gloeothece verrucosa]ADN16037.1 hypothetical protein Cyan7822_4117 [Gloeothece verrucosa PCC 7822]